MEPTISTIAGTRYKTDPEIELKSLRKTLAQIRRAVIAYQGELTASYGEGSEAEDISTRYSALIIDAIDRLV